MNEEQDSANDKRAKENDVRSFITSSKKTELPTQLSATMYDTRQIPEPKNDLTETDKDSESDSDEERDSEIAPGTENTEYTGLTDYRDKGPKIDPYRDTSHTNTQTKPRTDGNLCIHSVLDCGCEVMACQFSIEGSLLALGLIDGSIKVYSTDSFTLVHTLRDRDSIISSLPVTALQFFSSSQSYSLLLATYASGSVKCWYVWGGECLWMVREGSVRGSEEAGEGQRQTLSLSVSPLGDKAVTGGSDSAIHLYDLHTQQRLLTCSASSSKTLMDGHRFRVFALTFHPEIEKEFISGGWDNTIQFWDTRQQHAVRMLSGPHVCGDSLHVDPFHNQILSGSWRKDKALEIWDYNSGKKIIEVPNDPQGTSKIYSSHWLGQDKIVAAGSQSNMLRVIDRHTLMSVSKLYGLLSAVFSSCVCPGGKWVGLIAATSGNQVFLLDASSRQSKKQDHVYSPCEDK